MQHKKHKKSKAIGISTKTIQKVADASQEKKQRHTYPPNELLNALASLQVDPKYSDFTIVCGDDEYAVHKCIVCTRSEFFARACDSGSQESATNRIVLQEEPALVERMIEYLYTLDYQVKGLTPAPPELEVEPEPELGPKPGPGTEPANMPSAAEQSDDAWKLSDPLFFNILMYSLADRLLIQGLKLLSKAKAEHELSQRLKRDTFSLAITEIYSSTPSNDRGLRDVAVGLTMDHLMELRSGEPHWDAARGEETIVPVAFPDSLVQSVPQFSSDLVVAMMDKSVSHWGHHGLCRPNWRG